MKSILFFSSVLVILLASYLDVRAYDIILDEDEFLLVGEVRGAKSEEELKLEQKKKDADLTLRENLERSVNFPVGNERKDDKEWFKPFKFEEEQKVVEENIVSEKSEYMLKIDSCIEKGLGSFGFERNFANVGNVYKNAAYMSNNFEKTNSCLSELGIDIINNFYGADDDIINEYNDKLAGLYMQASDVNFNPSFCGERCSLKSLFDMQMAKVGEFKDYLYMLLSKAPRG